MKIDKLITHSGRFHADDVCAAVILTSMFPEAEVIRTRDDALIASMIGRAIIFDVGKRYLPEDQIYDHHMKGARKRDDGVTYSSFGLVWEMFGEWYLRDVMKIEKEHIRPLWKEFDQKFVRMIDALDNGDISPAKAGPVYDLSIGSFISDLNPLQSNDADPDALFLHAVHVSSLLIERRVMAIDNDLTMRNIVLREAKAQAGSPILIIKDNIEVQKALHELDDKGGFRFIVAPSSSGGWGVECVRKEYGLYENIIDLPEEWAGKVDEELVEASGIAGITFCHSGRFYAAADSLEAAMEVAETAYRIANDLRNDTPEP